jgi:hypothetical protein
MLLDQLSTALADRQAEKKLIHLDFRLNFDDCIATLNRIFIGDRQKAAGRNFHIRDRSLQAISEYVVILSALIGGQGLCSRADSRPISASSGANKRDEKIASCHVCAYTV